MNTKDLTIYNRIATVANDIFNNHLPYLQPGKYAVSELAKLSNKGCLNYDGLDESEIIHFQFDGFSCKFPAGSIFNILADLQTAWGINTACRAEFIKKADAAPVAVSFDVPQLAKTIYNALTPEKSNYSATKNYCIDTRRRALIGCNGHVLSAVAVPEMYVNKDAEITKFSLPVESDLICVDPVLLKSGKGTLKIDVNGNSTANGQTRPIYNDYKFPAWEKVLPAISDRGRVEIGTAFKEMKKAILAAAKFSNTYNNIVILRAVPGIPEIDIIGYRSDYNDKNTANETKVFKITLPAPVPFAFTFAINGKDINAVAAAENMFLTADARPLIFTAGNYFALLMPVFLDETPWQSETFTAPADNELNILDICRFPALDEENSPRAVAAAAEDAANVQDETAAPVFMKQETGNENAVLFKRNADFETPFYLDAPAVAADSLPANFDNLAPADQENIIISLQAAEDAAPVNLDEEETAAPVSLDEEEEKLYLDYLAAAAEDAANVQDEETAAPAEDAPAVAVSLPVSVFAVSVWYAVYNSANSLHGVYFSRAVADELLINSLFAAGQTWNILTVQDPSAAPAVWPAPVSSAEDAPAVAVNLDEETAAPAADSLETCPPFASVFAVMPEIWETGTAPAAEDAPAVQSEETAAPAADSLQAAEDAAPVAAVLIAANFARRFRGVFNVAAALFCLLLITAAPRFISPAVQKLTAPAVAVPVNLDEETAAPAEDAPAVAADSLLFAPETARAAAADSLPAVAKKQPQTARKRARRADPDKIAPAVAVSLPVAADSVRADSLAADSLETAPAVAVAAADSLQAAEDAAPVNLDEETAAPVSSAEDAPAVQDEETETETGAPAVPAAEDAPAPANGQTAPAPAAPGVSSVAAGSAPVSLPAVLLFLML